MPSLKEPLLFYSNQNQDDLHLLFQEAFKQAKSEILLHIYSLSDPSLIEILRQKEKEGLNVKIFYDATSCDPLTDQFAYPIKTPGLMHRKIAIIDQAQVYIGTANLTPQSLHYHDNLVAGLFDRELAQFFIHSDRSYKKFSLFETWLLPDFNNQAIDRLLQLISRAENSIQVAMFTLTHPDLIEALIQSRKKGVKVSCAVDYYSLKGASAKAVEKLKSADIEIFESQGRQLLHHKWAWIDQKILVLGSANWTKAAFAKNYDCFMIFNEITEKDKKFLNRLWRRITLEAK